MSPSDRSTAPSTMRFGDLDVSFDDRVLRPRPWTLAQSSWAADLLAAAPSGPVLELFAGVGHIGLSAVLEAVRNLVLVDLNPAACELAYSNAQTAGMAERVQVREGRIDEVLQPDERFAVIIADPPWVPSAGIGQHPEDPAVAIDGGEDGLDLARTACAVLHAHLAGGGSAVLQLRTEDQAQAIDRHVAAELGEGLAVVETRVFDGGVLVRIDRR